MPTLELVSRDLRSLTLAGTTVDYVLVRRRGRRGVGFKVDANGLTVNAPATMPLARIESLVRESERWVLRKIVEWRSRRVPPVEWRDGTALPYLGHDLVLRVAEGPRASIERCEGVLRATLRSVAAEAVLRAVVAWYKRAALSHFAARTFTLSRIAGVTPPRVMISPALSRWGSCNARREIRLAWRLVKARSALIDYVICHELAHLRHMNHSPAFWAEVERQCPGHARLRDELFATDHLYRSF